MALRSGDADSTKPTRWPWRGALAKQACTHSSAPRGVPSQQRFTQDSSLKVKLEARVGFEPTNGGFADLSLRPLGYRADAKKYSEIAGHLSVAAPSSKVVDL